MENKVYYLCNKCSQYTLTIVPICPNCKTHNDKVYLETPDKAHLYVKNEWPLDRSCSDEHDSD